MSSAFRDQEFQQRMLMFACRDRNFLKRVSGTLTAEDFKGKKGEGGEEFYWVAKKAFDFWRAYDEPIGGLLSAEMQDFLRENKRKISDKSRQKLMQLVETIKKAQNLVAVEAVEQKIAEYKERQNRRNAIKEILELEEKGELTGKKFRKICEEALKEYNINVRVSRYEKELKQRLKRRAKNRNKRYPLLFIDELDEQVRTFPRGLLGLILARYKIGKSTATVHWAQAYALQHLNVLLITTEDSKEMVEDRLDASWAGVEIKELDVEYSKVKRRLKRRLADLRAKIRIVDGTEGDLTVARIQEIWETMRNKGFQADMVIIDYDEGIEPREHYKDSGGERRESVDTYHDLRKFAAKCQIYLWVCAQTQRGKKGVRQMVVTGDDAATDISKIRKCAMCVGIGDGPEGAGDDSRFINITAHRLDRQKIGWPIVGSFKRGIFYSKKKTRRLRLRLESEKKESEE